MKNKKVAKITRFDNFDNLLDTVGAKVIYNYKASRILTNGKGMRSATFPSSLTDPSEQELRISEAGITHIKGINYVKQYQAHSGVTSQKLLIYASDKKVYINELLYEMYDVVEVFTNLTFENPPTAISFKQNNVDMVILSSEDKMVLWESGFLPSDVEDVPIVTSVCMNNGILFCTIVDPYDKIWYTSDFELDYFGKVSKKSDYILLDSEFGTPRKILTFDEDVYVFRDYGITKINMIKNEVVTKSIYKSNTKILTKTVAVGGNYIYFMTKDGLYSFNGYSVSRKKMPLIDDFTFDADNAVASIMSEKYYLALRIDFEDGKTDLDGENAKNNALLVFDIVNHDFELIRGVDIQSMLPLQLEAFEQMLFTFNTGPTDRIGVLDNSGALVDHNLPKFWSSDIMVKTMNIKLFTALSVNADEGVTFSLIFDDKTLNFTTYRSGANQFSFKERSREVSVEISSLSAPAAVKAVEIEYYED